MRNYTAIMVGGILLLIISNSLFAEDNKYIEKTEDSIHTIESNKQSIIQQAKICIIKHVKNDSVVLIGTSSGVSGLFGVGKRQESTTVIPQGEVVKFIDKESGIIFANSRINIKADMIQYSVQSTINLYAKDNKFKIAHTEIMYLQKDVGYGSPDEYKKLPKKGHWGSSLVETAVNGLNSLTKEIVSCIKSPVSTDW